MPEDRCVQRFALLALALAISSTVLVRSSPVVADAVGCTGIRDTMAFPGAACTYSQGNTCYLCERSYNGGADISCAESPDGSIAYCKPFTPSVNP
ncbi:MAG: hypothetical protein JF614_17985 [Acidobacteria bacterium]|nr:hypothetical protein [Acidobacteriota bacterium]